MVLRFKAGEAFTVMPAGSERERHIAALGGTALRVTHAPADQAPPKAVMNQLRTLVGVETSLLQRVVVEELIRLGTLVE